METDKTNEMTQNEEKKKSNAVSGEKDQKCVGHIEGRKEKFDDVPIMKQKEE